MNAMGRCAGVAAVWGMGGVLLLAAVMVRSPFLFAVRPWLEPALLVLGVAAAAVFVGRAMGQAVGRPRGLRAWVLAALWVAVPLQTVAGVAAFRASRDAVLAVPPAAAADVGRRFIVGYEDAAAMRPLVARGLIAGVFVTRRNLDGRPLEAVRQEIAGFQALRAAAGLPPLIVASDQEGGIVSRLSPPLTALPALSTVAGLTPDERRAAAAAFGATHGRELHDLGVTVNFAPVVDLTPDEPASALDRHSMIHRRAISSAPDTVAAVARAYTAALEAEGVVAVLKHFPGLGRVTEDTHLFPARLDAAPAELEATDWRPFRRVLDTTDAWMMLSHVTLAALDPERPVSQSRAVVQGLLRGRWGFDGALVTDDMTMGASFGRGLCTATRDALDAGVDLLLIAYDWEQYYPAMACAMEGPRPAAGPFPDRPRG